ncbi:MAG: photosynthetic complex assembly protein PuhC [Oceanibaculum sp.]
MARVSHLGYLGDRTGRKPNLFPTKILAAAIALLVFTAGAVLFGQLTGIGTVRVESGSPVAVRDIVILRTAADEVIVRDAASGREVVRYAVDEGGFVRGSLRAFARMRQVAKVPLEAPYRLIRWESGQVSLSDTATGERIYLEAFGRDNAAAFAALLDRREGGKP